MCQHLHILEFGREEGFGLPFKLQDQRTDAPRSCDDRLDVVEADLLGQDQQLVLGEHVERRDGQRLRRIQEAVQLLQTFQRFKREAKAFFSPKLQNVEVLAHLLDKYIQTSKNICEKMDKSCLTDFSLKTSEPAVEICVDMMDPNFRMVFLFQEELYQGFIQEFRERQPRMLEFLGQLEESAVQLDRMNKGAKISSVAGSSVGAVGGVLSIVGLALIPVTAGVSLALTMTGVGLGVTSGVNSLLADLCSENPEFSSMNPSQNARVRLWL
ncbi:unnamed protein product, partial [Menidia menidia]